MKPKIAPYLRLKRGGPPACVDELQVRDRETGKIVEDVIEADVSLRFVAVHARDGNGQLRFSDGKAVPERRKGDFQIEYKPSSMDEVSQMKPVIDLCFDLGEAHHTRVRRIRPDSVDRFYEEPQSIGAGAFVQELLRFVQELEEEVQRISEMLDRPSK